MPLCAKNSKRWPPSKSKRWTRWRTSRAAGAITHLKLFSKRPIGEPTSFLTATVLLAYKDAEQAFGLKAEPRVVKRAVACLEKLRTPAGSYVYSLSHSFYPGRPINRHTGSLARTPAGDLALMRYDPSFISRSQLEDGLERIWSRGGWLSLAVKKPIPHESFAQNAGYFFSITGIITPPAAWRKWRRNTWRAMRPIWQATSCPCRKKTGPGGITPCTITTNLRHRICLICRLRVRESLYPSDAATTFMTHVPPADDHFSRHLVPASSRSAGESVPKEKTDVIPIAKNPGYFPRKTRTI